MMDLFRWFGWPFRHSPVEDGEPDADPRSEEDDIATDDDSEATRDRSVPTRDEFFTPMARFQGEFTPENLAFDANLQEFAQRVAYLCGLETAGKLSPDEAHSRIRDLYEQLARTKEGLGIGEPEA